MSIITVFEHQTLTTADFSNHCGSSSPSNINGSGTSDFHWLLTKVEAGLLPCFTLGVQSGQVVINVRHYLSIIYLPSGNTLEILPKVSNISERQTTYPITNPTIHPKNNTKNRHKDSVQTTIRETHQWVSLMLGEVYHLKRYLPVLASSQTDSLSNQPNNLPIKTWIQPIIEQWFELLIQLQLPKNYNQNQQNHPQAQGKLLIKQQLKHNTHRPHYRYTSQQQLGLNKLWGQFFYTASTQVQTLGIRIPPIVAQQLQTLLQVQSPLHDLLPNQWQQSYQQLKQQLSISKPQQSEHSHKQLTQTLELAWFILKLHNMPDGTPIKGDALAPSVMINMHQAFEQWVTIKFSEQFADLGQLTAQSQSVWLKDSHRIKNQRYLKPDIVIESALQNTLQTNKTNKTDKIIELIADIKYKSIHKTTDIKPSDLYQLFTYQQHWQAKKAWLIFPRTNDLQYPLFLTGTDKKGIANLEIKIVPFDMLKGEFII